MTSLLNNAKYLNRLWAALNSDFECLENLYLLSQGWKFADFAYCCRQQEITLVMHATLGRGKGLDDHYNKTTDLILQTAKSFWLRPYTHTKNSSEDKLDTKRRLGGFFLTYLMYMKQPHKDRIKISMGLKDLEMAVTWLATMRDSLLNDQIDFIIEDLVAREGFQFQLAVPSFGFQAEIRNYLNNSKSEIIPLTREMKNIQDEVTYSGLTLQAQSSYVKCEALKDNIRKAVQNCVNESSSGSIATEGNGSHARKYEPGTEDNCLQSRSFEIMSKFTGKSEWGKCIEKLTEQTDKPVLTIQNLTATEAIDRRMMMETRKRIERNKKKQMQAYREGQPKTNRPYVNEGGIFGRKKEVFEEEQKEKRERGLCSGNLWTFINGCEFGSIPDEVLAAEQAQI